MLLYVLETIQLALIYSLIINLYMMGTQEEKWLKEKQKGSKSAMLLFIVPDRD